MIGKGINGSSEAAALLGRLGGRARLIKMSKEARSKIARNAAEARWSRVRLAELSKPQRPQAF